MNICMVIFIIMFASVSAFIFVLVRMLAVATDEVEGKTKSTNP